MKIRTGPLTQAAFSGWFTVNVRSNTMKLATIFIASLLIYSQVQTEEIKHNIDISEALTLAQKALEDSSMKNTHVITSISLMTEFIKNDGGFPIYDVSLTDKENPRPWVAKSEEDVGKVLLDRLRVFPDRTCRFEKMEWDKKLPRRIQIKKEIEPGH